MTDERREAEILGASFGGAVSPGSLLANSLHASKSMQACVVISLFESGEISVGFTKGSGLQLLGLMDIGHEKLRESLFKWMAR